VFGRHAEALVVHFGCSADRDAFCTHLGKHAPAAMPLGVFQLQRPAADVPWGFAVQRSKVMGVSSGSVASQAGLVPGYHVLQVNGRGVARRPHDDVTSTIRGQHLALQLLVTVCFEV
jgi:predicted metalloprotease with PDZ domain